MNEVEFDYWEWEEELEVLQLEHIALGKIHSTKYPLSIPLTIIFTAMIIVGVGLAISSVVFIMEIIIFKFMR